MDNKTNDIHWLIGIIEGEGCFNLSLKKKKGKSARAYHPRIQITNTNLTMIEECKRILSENGLSCYFYCNLPVNKKPYYRLEVAGFKRVKRFYGVFLPFFRSRKEQVVKLLEYVDLRLSKYPHAPISDEEHTIAKELYILNGKNPNSNFHL